MLQFQVDVPVLQSIKNHSQWAPEFCAELSQAAQNSGAFRVYATSASSVFLITFVP